MESKDFSFPGRLHLGLRQLILTQFRDFWAFYLGALICLILTHYIQSHLPFLAKELAEKITTNLEAISLSQFAWLAIGILIFRTSSRLLFFYPARVLQRNLRTELVERLEATSPFRYALFSPGQLFQIVGNDMDQLRALIGFALLQVGNIVVALAILIPKLMQFNVQIVLGLIPMLLTFTLFTIIVGRNRFYYRKTQDAQGEVQNFVMESYVGKKTIKNYHAEGSFIELFKNFSWRELWYFYRAGIGVAFSIPLIPLGVGLSFLWGAHIIQQEELGASSLVLFSGFVFLFLEPLMFLSWIGIVFSRSHGAWRRIKELVVRLSKPSYQEQRLEELNPTHQFQSKFPEAYNTTFDFWGGPISLTLPVEKWTVLIGKTGCGKTEIIKQLAEVFSRHHCSLSYVAQDPYLYNDTIEKNIFLGKKPTEEEKEWAKELLKVFALDYLASDMDELLALEVGENGKRLSGGQAKRVCLVRSLLSEGKILLWDDPFSSVDVILERQIVYRLKDLQILKGKTLVMTSHRLTTAKNSDRVVFLQKGEGVIESGKTSELLKEGYQTYEYFKDQMV